jgi:hypothetical protein
MDSDFGEYRTMISATLHKNQGFFLLQRRKVPKYSSRKIYSEKFNTHYTSNTGAGMA